MVYLSYTQPSSGTHKHKIPQICPPGPYMLQMLPGRHKRINIHAGISEINDSTGSKHEKESKFFVRNYVRMAVSFMHGCTGTSPALPSLQIKEIMHNMNQCATWIA